MPYGWMNAPSVFQAFVDKIFRDLHGQGVVVYIDDILIHTLSMCPWYAGCWIDC